MPKTISLWSYRFIRWSLASLFFYSGIVKLADPGSFALLIDAFGLAPDIFSVVLSYLLPIAEIIIAVGLFLDIRGSLFATTGLICFFMAVLGYGIHMGLDIDCGCFGPEDPEAKAFHGLRSALYRDLAMFLAISYLPQ